MQFVHVFIDEFILRNDIRRIQMFGAYVCGSCASTRLLARTQFFSFHLYNEIKSTPKLLNTHARTRTPSEIHTNVWYLTRETNCQDPQQQQQQQHEFTLASFILFGSCFDDWT